MDGMTPRRILRAAAPAMGALAWSPSGAFIACVLQDGTIAIWEPDRGEPVQVLKARKANPRRLAWSPDETRLLAGDAGGDIRLWVVRSGESVARLGEHMVLSAAWHPDGSLVAAGSRDAVTIWGLDGHVLREILSDWSVWCVQWSPDGSMLATGSQGEEALRAWTGDASEVRWSHTMDGFVLDVAWSPSRADIAVALQDDAVLIMDAATGQLRSRLEGYTDSVATVSYSSDGKILASADVGGELRLSDTDRWRAATVRSLGRNVVGAGWRGVAFHPRLPILAVAERGELHLWDVDPARLFAGGEAHQTVRHASAKIVLVGESNVGKSCLAMRLAEDRYPRDDEQATTHGMRFWPLDAATLHPRAVAPEGQRREVVLWDFGGQHEYRIVHQLFLNDTTVALVIFDPTRGEAAFEDARDWNMRLERQLAGRGAIKLLVGAKQDDASPLVDRAAIGALCEECGFQGYVEVSAKTDRNIASLREELANALDWDALATTSRPELFQHVRDHIEQRRAAGDVVVLVDELQATIKDKHPALYDEAAVSTVARQLAVQGVIAQTTLTEGADALVLQVPVIERYAGSLIVAARSNPRGVPALEERLLGSPALPLPGIEGDERLPRLDERIVLECVAELMITHGLCFRHENLLIFPSFFPAATGTLEDLPHSVSLYYDFTGAIDNLYASLVARLVLSDEFGNGRLYPSRVEFDAPGQGICGIRQINRTGGLAHLDLFFSDATTPDRRALFAQFVADHLRSQGVEIREHQKIACGGCGHDIEEDIVQTNVAAGRTHVICPWCWTQTPIGAESGELKTAESKGRILALRMEVDRRKRADSKRAKAAVASGATRQQTDDEPIRLLHLSDLHFTSKSSPEAHATALLQDLRNGPGLGFESVEYLVISGDITDRGSDEGFERGRSFVNIVNEALGVSAERCIFVPGNHDVQDVDEAYDYFASAAKARVKEPDEDLWHREGSIICVANAARYPSRLSAFSDGFFHKIVQRPYPPGYAEQGIPYLFPETGIQFLSLNSCWEIDHFHRSRASIHPDAVANVVRTADRQVAESRERGLIAESADVLRIGVWHHALQHAETIRDTGFATILQQADVRLALHGDVHELNRDRFRYWHAKAMHVVGAGSFGSPQAGRVENVPCLYNLLELARDFSSVRVHTRRRAKPNGAWDGWNEWPLQDGRPGGQPFYDLDLA